MMEFEEMQKVWNEQKGETLYTINEAALHKIVTQKKNAAEKKINSEEIITGLFISTAAIILIIGALSGGHNWAFISSGILIVDLIYIQYFRRKRKKAENKFDRTLLSELDHAIYNTNAIIRFYSFLIAGFLVPLCGLYIIKTFIEGASSDKWIIMAGVPVLCVILMQLILKKIRRYRKKQLMTLRKKLTAE